MQSMPTEVLAVWWQCQRRALAVVVFELGLEIWAELGRVTSSSEHFQVELIAWIVMWIMRALCVLELYVGHSIRVWRAKSGVKGDASGMLALGAFAIPCLVMSSEELWVEDHHERRVLGSLGCCVMGIWWDWGPERTVWLVWIIWSCEHRQRQKSWWCSEVRLFRKIFRRMENWLVFGIVWMSREWESEQLEGLPGFWVVEGSSRGSSSEGKFRIEDILLCLLCCGAYHWCIGGILKATGYRVLEHHESWGEAGDTGFWVFALWRVVGSMVMKMLKGTAWKEKKKGMNVSFRG